MSHFKKQTKKTPNIPSGYDLNNLKTPDTDTHKNAHIWNCFYFQIDQ